MYQTPVTYKQRHIPNGKPNFRHFSEALDFNIQKPQIHKWYIQQILLIINTYFLCLQIDDILGHEYNHLQHAPLAFTFHINMLVKIIKL